MRAADDSVNCASSGARGGKDIFAQAAPNEPPATRDFEGAPVAAHFTRRFANGLGIVGATDFRHAGEDAIRAQIAYGVREKFILFLTSELPKIPEEAGMR
jgi:hypothetical protein